MKSIVVLIEACIIFSLGLSPLCLGQRIPPPPKNFINNLNNQQQQNGSGPGLNLQNLQQQQQNEELANVKDENIKRVLLELSTLQTPSQMSETMARVAQLVGPLFIVDFDKRKDEIVTQGRDASTFPQRLLSAVTDIQGEEVKALVLQKKLDLLHSGDFAFLPLAIQYGLQEEILRNLSGTKLASVAKANPGDTVIAYKISDALIDRPDQQIEFLQSLGTKLLPEVQRTLMKKLLEWWGDPHAWKDRELSLLTSAGNPLLAFMQQSQLESFDDELADRFVTSLGQTQDIARGWWRKPMSLKKAWFDLAKGARYFGAVHEWSFRRMQKLSFLLEGASPEDLELIPPVPEIKGLVIGNHYTELQARVVFDAFYHTPPLSQEDLQEFQFHILDLIPSQLQRFDFADSFGTLDEMMSIMERQTQPAYPTVLQISYFMWPILNSTNSMTIAPPTTWQKRELSQIGKMFYLLPKSVINQIKPDIINWDSNILAAIRSNHLSQFQIWKLASQILLSVDERFKPDYIFMIPSPFQKGIPSQNISQALLGTTTVRPEVLRALIEETPGMLTSQKAVILQRINHRISESNIIRQLVSTTNPSEMFNLISPKVLSKNMATIIKTIMEMPETGRFGVTSIQTKLLPRVMLSLWLKWVRENAQITRWTAEDLLGRSPMGATHELNFAILGLSCRDIEIVDPWDILSVIMHYRHEVYVLRRFKTTLKFNVNLRSCVLSKFLEYLKQKRFLDGDQADGHVLAGITGGEVEAIGGEVLSLIPTKVLDPLQMDKRQSIIQEIGKLQMMELFSLASLQTLHWYGSTLFRDIEISVQNTTTGDIPIRKQRQAIGIPANNTTNATSPDPSNGDAAGRNAFEDPGAGLADDPTVDIESTVPTFAVAHKHGIDLESLNSMGNLLCYAENMFDTEWPRTLLKDVLEAKTSVGEKTCCLSKMQRNKWFEVLKEVYGSDTSSWNEFDLTSIGDFLIVLPEADLQKISSDSLGKAVTPISRQSAFAHKVFIPGQVKYVQFVTACTEELGNDGQDFMAAYKILMKRLFQASQWMVNTVKTTQELVRDGVGRTGRIPRWAEHTLVKRQVPAGGDPAFPNAPTNPAYSPASYSQGSPYYPASTGGDMYSQGGQSMFGGRSSPGYGSSSSTPNYPSQGYTSSQPSAGFAPQSQPLQQSGYGPTGSSLNTPQYTSSNPSGYTQPAYSPPSPQSSMSSQQTPPISGYTPQATVPSQQTAPVSGYPPQPGSQSYPPQATPASAIDSSSYSYSPNYQPATSGGGMYSQQTNAPYYAPRPTIQPQSVGAGSYSQPGYSPSQSANTYNGQPQQQNPSSYYGSGSQLTSQGPYSPSSMQQQSPYPSNAGNYPQYPNSYYSDPTSTGIPPQQPGSNIRTNEPGMDGQQTISSFAPSSINTGVMGSGAGADASAGNAGAVGGSFANANSFAQTNANNANANANAFSQGGNFGQGNDFSQSNSFAQANTFATRGISGNQQGGNTGNLQQQGGTMGFQQQGGNFGMQQQGGNMASMQQQGGNMANMQQQGGNLGFQQGGTGMQQQGTNIQGQQQGGNFPSQQQGGNTLGQQQGVNTLGQQQGGNIPGQQQGGNLAGQQGFGQQQQGINGQSGSNLGSGVGASTIPVTGSVSSTATGRAHDATTDSQDVQDQRQRSLEFQGVLQDETHNSDITCHGIKAAGPAAIGLTIDDLGKLSTAELFDCVEALGKIDWDDETKGRILTLLKQKLTFNKDSINALTLIEMGDLVTAFNAKPQDGSVSDGFTNTSTVGNVTIHSDVSMIDFTLPQSLDVLSILGQQITDPGLLKSLAEKFNQDNRIFPGFSEGIARPENLRIVVMSLGNIICGLTDKIVNSIFETDASLFIDTSRVLGKLEGCSTEVLSTLAAHAVRPSNYGPPRLWSQEDVETVGVVFSGLKPDALSTIPPDAMQGLTPLAVKNMPPASLLSFTTDQLSKMSFSAAMALTPSQLNTLSTSQSDALRSVLEIQSDAFNVPASDITPTSQQHPEFVERNTQNDTDLHTRNKDGVSDGSSLDPPTVPALDESRLPAADNNPTTTEATTTPAPEVIDEGPPQPTSFSPKFASFSLPPCYMIATLIPVIYGMNI